MRRGEIGLSILQKLLGNETKQLWTVQLSGKRFTRKSVDQDSVGFDGWINRIQVSLIQQEGEWMVEDEWTSYYGDTVKRHHP